MSIQSRLTKLEKQLKPTNQELIDYIRLCHGTNTNPTLKAKVERFLTSKENPFREMSDSDLIDFITNKATVSEC